MSFDWISPAAARMLVELLDADHYISWFNRNERNPEGIGSSKTVFAVRDRLKHLQLIEEYLADIRPRHNLTLTERGRQIAEHLKAIEEIFQTP